MEDWSEKFLELAAPQQTDQTVPYGMVLATLSQAHRAWLR